MPERLTLSIDAMGGDDAPDMVIEGVDIAARALPRVRFVLFGDDRRLAPLLERFPRVAAVAQVRHTADAVSSREKAGTALRSGRRSSMRLAIDAVGDGEAHGVVSAGNTGALMAMAKFVLKTLPGIDRPAIAAAFPTERGQSIMLDLGANVQCDADNLVQFAVMGEVFARNVLGLAQPSIGILNIGVEHLKGNHAVQGAYAALQQIDLPIRFYGFVEGDDIGAGTVDVIVTDGFTGNVALKTTEGTVKMVIRNLRGALGASLSGRLGGALARAALRHVSERFDPRRYNGAMFLGLNGICVKSHGGTDAQGFANAVRVAAKLVDDQVIKGIQQDFGRLGDDICVVDRRATGGR